MCGPKREMKAVTYDRYGGPEELRLSSIEIPEPEKDQVRVKVSACAVNLSDWEYLSGSPLYARLIGGRQQERRADAPARVHSSIAGG